MASIEHNTTPKPQDPAALAAASTSGIYTSHETNPSDYGIGGNLVPLTTVFTPSVWCATRWLHSTTSGGQQVVLNFSPSGFKPSIKSDYYRGCMPYDGTTKASFSPGVCPSGHEVNAITVYSPVQTWRGVCCSSGWYTSGSCRTTFTTPFTAITGYTESGTTFWDSSIESFADTFKTSTDSQGSLTTGKGLFISPILKVNRTVVTSGVASATPIVVAWQSKDLSLFPEGYASSLAKRMGVEFGTRTAAEPGSSGSSIPGPTGSSTPPTGGSAEFAPRGLSTAAKAGIGVGVSLFVVLIIGILLALLYRRRRRRRRKTARSKLGDDDAGLKSKAELQGDSILEADTNAALAVETQGHALNEADAGAARALEMEGDGSSKGFMKLLLGRWRAEVDGDRPPVAEMEARSVKVVPGPPAELE